MAFTARILHIEVPRALTTTVRAPDFRCAAELAQRDIVLDWVDVNTDFWAWALRQGGDGPRLDDLFVPALDRRNIDRLLRSLVLFRRRRGVLLTLHGFSFGGAVQSSVNLDAILAHAGVRQLAADYTASIRDRLALGDPALRVVSLGVTSAESLYFAAALARELRSTLDPACRIVLGRHSYENFSLSQRRADVEANGALARYFDHVVYHEEHLPTELAALCGRPVASMGRPFSPSRYLASTRFIGLLAVAPARCFAATPLTRNKCYWKKCTFCAQIGKHLEDQYHANDRELAAAFEELSTLAAAGFRHIVFTDEAITPANLRRLCDFLEESGTRVRWTPRIIADASFKGGLIERMARAGCFEVLFGLETISPGTARAMGKVSSRAGEREIREMLERFTSQGIGVFVNIIRDFPTESPAEFERTYAFALELVARLPGTTCQVNRFALMHGTTIHREPERFGLRNVEPASRWNDLLVNFPYEDAFGRTESGFDDDGRYLALSLGMSADELARVERAQGAPRVLAAYLLNYASFGMMHKCATGENLFHHCWKEEAVAA